MKSNKINSHFSVSVVIPTKNRLTALQKMLDSLFSQTILPGEIIIIDQSDISCSGDVVGRWTKRNDTVRFVYVHDLDVRGAAEARNKAIVLSTGSIVFFFDDDVVLDENYIEATLDVFIQESDVVGVGGVITNCQYLTRPKIRIFNDFFYHGLFKDVRQFVYLNYKKFTDSIKVNKLSGGVCAYRRSVFEQDRFDEKFDSIFDGYSFGEDIELSLRLSKKYTLMITPYAKLVHDFDGQNRLTKTVETALYLEAASWTYIFLKNFRYNLFCWLCYLWLCVGWTLRGLKAWLKKDAGLIYSLFKGFKQGVTLLKNQKRLSL